MHAPHEERADCSLRQTRRVDGYTSPPLAFFPKASLSAEFVLLFPLS